MDSSQKNRINELLATLAQKNEHWKRGDPEYAPDLTINPGVSVEQFNELQQKLGEQIPPDLVEWLSMCNGFGGKYIEYLMGHNEIISLSELYPYYNQHFRSLPIAGDGCGDYYWVKPIAKQGEMYYPVVFIDQIDMFYSEEEAIDEGEMKYTYIVASSIFNFIEIFLDASLFCLELMMDQGYSHRIPDDTPPDFWWPFEKEEVLKRDPAIESLGLTLPWDAD